MNNLEKEVIASVVDSDTVNSDIAKLEIKTVQVITPEKAKQIEDLTETIKKLPINEVRTVGAEIQTNMTSSLDAIIGKCKAMDCGEAGKALENLSITATTPLTKNSLMGKHFGKMHLSFKRFTSRYKKVGEQLETIIEAVEREKDGLISALDELSELISISKTAYDSTDVYEYALEKCIAEQEKVLEGLDQSTIEYLDNQRLLNTYRRRLETFSASRVAMYQTIKESMLLMITNQTLADDMQYGVDNIIPLWKAKLITAANVEMQKNSIELNRAMRDSFAKLIEENANNISDNVKRIQDMSNSSVIDVVALQKANKTLDDVITTLKKDLVESGETHKKVMKSLKAMHNGTAEALTSLTANTSLHNDAGED